jgi:general secretion pathway protein K
MTHERGAALVLAMLIAALAAAVAATVFADQQRWSRTVEHRRDQVQAQALAMAGVQWARQILDDDGHRSDIDHLGEPWAVPLPPIPLENGEIRGAIVDAQGRLNINALGSDSATSDQERARIAKLFALYGGPVGAIDAIADWIDPDARVRDGGAEDAYYAAQSVPGLAANAPMLRTAELASVKGVTAQALAAVAPFVSALPAGTPVNVNTAPAEVLASILDNLTGDRFAELLATRAQKPFTTIAEFRSRLPNGVTLASESALATQSSFFYVTVEARQGTTRSRARALLNRSANAWPAIVWQVVE